MDQKKFTCLKICNTEYTKDIGVNKSLIDRRKFEVFFVILLPFLEHFKQQYSRLKVLTLKCVRKENK